MLLDSNAPDRQLNEQESRSIRDLLGASRRRINYMVKTIDVPDLAEFELLRLELEHLVTKMGRVTATAYTAQMDLEEAS